MFLKSDSVLRCSASLGWVRPSGVPQRFKYYQSTTTSCADDGVAYAFRFSAPTDPLQSSLPCGGELRTGLAPIKPGTAGLLSAGRTQDLPGSWRIHPISLPRSQIPAGSSALTLSDRRYCPQTRHAEDASTTSMSGFDYAASISAAYASSNALPHPHARLASGWWLAFTGRESNPLDSIESFCPLHRTSSFPRLYLALALKLPIP